MLNNQFSMKEKGNRKFTIQALPNIQRIKKADACMITEHIRVFSLETIQRSMFFINRIKLVTVIINHERTSKFNVQGPEVKLTWQYQINRNATAYFRIR
jgi:hypothetical protein